MSASAAQRHNAPSARWLVRPGDLDPVVVVSALVLLVLGAVMVASASITVAARELGDPWHYLIKQAAFVGVGLAIAAVVVQIPLERWRQLSMPLLLVGLALLALVLVPGFGRTVNGSTRWLELGFFGLQVSEGVKLAFLIYLADYAVRRREQLLTTWGGFLRPLMFVALGSFLLLLEPDFGAAVVLVATALLVLFLGGVPLWRFILLAGVAVAAVIALALSSPYRMERITAFLDPWADPFDSGFQLTQSLIAIGSGGWAGVGLGGSVQKLFYLPEGHTDFLFAIFAEETGLVGVITVLVLYVVLVGRALNIAKRADAAGHGFAGLLAAGIGGWIALQAFINAGVNMGLLPTKGLTLPLMSYGGSSTLVMCAAIGLLLRAEREVSLTTRQARRRKAKGST